VLNVAEDETQSSCMNGVQSGVIMNRSFQPHESHVPFLLQFKVSRGTPTCAVTKKFFFGRLLTIPACQFA